MNKVKFKPFGIEPSTINNLVDGFFNSGLADIIGADFSLNQPSVNIIETAENYRIEVAAPGLAKKDFDVTIEKDQLIIAATKKAEKEEGETKYKRREFDYSTFKRSFHLPEAVNVEQIAAKHEHGVLTLTLPKEVKTEVKQTIKIS